MFAKLKSYLDLASISTSSKYLTKDDVGVHFQVEVAQIWIETVVVHIIGHDSVDLIKSLDSVDLLAVFLDFVKHKRSQRICFWGLKAANNRIQTLRQ